MNPDQQTGNFMRYFILFISAVLTAALVFPLAAETLFLKDGTVIEGAVVENTEKELVFRDKQKKIYRVPQKDVSMLIKSKKYKFGDNNSPATGDYPHNSEMTFGVYPGLVMPFGTLAKIGSTGYGAGFYMRKQLFFENFEIGADSGLYYMKGKDLEDEKNLSFKRFFIVPLFISTGYRIDLTEKIHVLPCLSFGGIYIDSKYTDYTGGAEDEDFRRFEPALKADIQLCYMLTEFLSVSFSPGYVIAAENSGIIHFTVISAGLGYHF